MTPTPVLVPCAEPRATGAPVDGLHRCKCGRVVVLHAWRWVHWPVHLAKGEA